MSPPRIASLALFASLAACTPDEEPVGGCPWPDAPVVPDGVVTESCGWYALGIGDHLYVSVYLNEPESLCSFDASTGLGIPDPIYSYMGNDAPKYTYDITAQVPGPDQEFLVTCADGTDFELRIDVE